MKFTSDEYSFNKFYETLENSERKVHLNLSDYAWNILENDLSSFSSSQDFSGPARMSRLINAIFINFYPLSSANISDRLQEKKAEYQDLLGIHTITKTLDPKIREEIIQKWVKSYMLKLEKELTGYPKGINRKGQKIRMQKDAAETIRRFKDNDYEVVIFKRLGAFLKAVVEEYCRLPFTSRERIVYQSALNTIETAIHVSHPLILVTESNTRYELLPYKVMVDSLSTYNYITGFNRRVDSTQPYTPASFRLSRIASVSWKINTRHDRTALTDSEKSQLESLIAERGVQFLLTDCITAKVQFTEKGLKMYNSILSLRPQALSQTQEEKQRRIFTFNATQYQIASYFFKFGADAVILEPELLRKRFRRMYSEALHAYTSRQ